MEIDHWKFPRQGIPLAMKPSLFLSVHLPPFLPFLVFRFPFIIGCVPLIKCCYIQREGFSFFFFFFGMPAGSVPTT